MDAIVSSAAEDVAKHRLTERAAMLRQSSLEKLERAKKMDPLAFAKRERRRLPRSLQFSLSLSLEGSISGCPLQDRSLLRLEYTRFKDRSAYIFVLLPAFALLLQHFDFRDVSWSIILVHVFTLYCISHDPQCVLLINGSRIAQWWITHHYISAFGSVVLLMASARVCMEFSGSGICIFCSSRAPHRSFKIAIRGRGITSRLRLANPAKSTFLQRSRRT